MTAINQKEYLKKYLSIGSKEGKKKKRKKKAAVGDRVNIIDDDVDISNLTSLEEAADLFNTNEDAPQVVGVIDERPMHLRIADYHNDSWKPLGAQDDESSKQSNANRQGQEENESNSGSSGHKFNMSLSSSLQKGRAESPVRQRNRRDDGSSSSQRYSNNSPPRKGKNQYTRNDESPQREHKKDDIDYSPSRNKNSDNSSPPRIKDADNSPPRITRRNFDNSPRRKSRWDSADSSPIRKNKEGKNTPQHQERKNSDSSPPRRRDTDNSPPRRNRKEVDNSPPHREKRNRNNSDSSPPRKRGTKRYTDSTPPRRNDGSRRNDNSPPRPQRRRDFDNSPPRKSHPREETDNSPPRRSRRDDDNSPPRRNRRDSDNTPPRKHIKKELESPPRPSSSKTVQEPPQRKLLPGDKKGKYLIPAKRSTDFNAQKMTKTLEGKSAGLQNKEELVKENEAFRKREDELFKNMSSDVSGANAAPVLRDRKTGKIRDLQKEAEERKEKEKREEENKEKYSRWGRGLKQVEAYEDKLTQDLHEMNKPLARYADDEDLEKFLKEQEREGDPMLAYIRKKKKKKVVESGKPLKPQYEGEFNPNRFGIVPGYRWDGVDRSNGYEKKWFQVQNSKRAQQEEIYKWSTEDM